MAISDGGHGFDSQSVKSDTVVPMARHRYKVFSESAAMALSSADRPCHFNMLFGLAKREGFMHRLYIKALQAKFC